MILNDIKEYEASKCVYVNDYSIRVNVLSPAAFFLILSLNINNTYGISFNATNLLLKFREKIPNRH